MIFSFDNEINTDEDLFYMQQALLEAELAAKEDEVPVGAIIVCGNRVIARAHNQTEKLKDVTAHAEVLAITAASAYLGSKYLDDCTLYVTLEPCIMCAGALYWSQIGRVVYGASDEKRGFSKNATNLLHPKTKLRSGVLLDKCQEVIKKFFKTKR